MEIYTGESKEKFHRFLANEAKKNSVHSNLYTALPLYTISEELFQNILERNHVAAEKQQMLLQELHRVKDHFLQTLRFNSVEDRIPVLSQEEYAEMPLTLSLSEMFTNMKSAVPTMSIWNIITRPWHLQNAVRITQFCRSMPAFSETFRFKSSTMNGLSFLKTKVR